LSSSPAAPLSTRDRHSGIYFFQNINTGNSLASLAATVRALAGIYSPQPPGSRKEDSSCKTALFGAGKSALFSDILNSDRRTFVAV
jgi:hypothetical protein